jgi:tetratricopeptide (TPR) repeat protein
MNAPTTSSPTKSADRPHNGYSIFTDALPEALARDDFTNLAVLLRYAREGCWAFAIYSHVAAREEVVAALKTLLQPLPTYEWTYSPERPSPLSYLDALSETQRHERGVVFFFDLERASDALWKSLDYNRETLSAQPHGLVFWISSAGRGRAMRAAPHFWSQRSGVFDFRLAPGPLPPLSDWARSGDIVIDDWENILRQIRITQGLLDELLATPDAPPGVVAAQHLRLGKLCYYVDRLPAAHTHLEAAESLAAAVADPRFTANVQKALGDLALREDELGEARRRYEAALAIYPAIGDRLGEANVQKALGDLALREDELGEARRRYEAALAIYPAIGDRLGEANVQKALGDLALREDELGEARRRYEAALAIYPAIGDRLGEANVQKALGDLALREDELGEARRRYEAALAIYPAIGDRLGEANVQKALGDLALREDELGEARRRYEAALAIYPAIGDRLGEANVLAALARVELLEGQAERAMTLLTYALDFYQSINGRYNIAAALYNVGSDLLRLDRRENAAPLLLQAAELFEEIGLPQYAASARQMAGDAPTSEQQAARLEAAVVELRQRGDASLLPQALAALLALRMEMENWQGAVETA